MSDASRDRPVRHLRAVLEPANDGGEQLPTDSLPTHSELSALPQPAWGVRAEQPGPRGCWARKANGDLCGAAPRRGEDFCNAHSGLGVAKNPAEWSVIGRERSAESRAERAALRLELGITRPDSIRGMLRARVWAARERVASAALAGLDSESPSARSRSALALLDAVEPQPKAALSLPLPSNPEGVEGMGLAELRAVAERLGLDPSPPSLPQVT